VILVPPRLWFLFLFDYLSMVLMLHHFASPNLDIAGWQGLQLGFLQLPTVAMVYRWGWCGCGDVAGGGMVL
jgi:hypothetical protein